MKGWPQKTIDQQPIEDMIREAKKNAQLELLNWFMKICGSGQTVGMIRKHAHNKFIEVSGEGERA